jgi:hypothetical protein
MRPRFRPSPAMIVACIALFVALGGTATAVTYVVSSNSQIGPGTVSGNKPPTGKHSNIIAGSINGNDVADNSLHGTDINESTLGQVPSAAKANDAFSTFHDGALDVPSFIGSLGNPIADLSIPHAGSYVINATLTLTSGGGTAGEAYCVLNAGGDTDRKNVTTHVATTLGGESMALQVVHTFSDGALVTLSCADYGVATEKAEYIKITAVQVNNLTNSGF